MKNIDMYLEIKCLSYLLISSFFLNKFNLYIIYNYLYIIYVRSGAFILFHNNLNDRCITEKTSIEIILYLYLHFTSLSHVSKLYHITSFHYFFLISR